MADLSDEASAFEMSNASDFAPTPKVKAKPVSRKPAAPKAPKATKAPAKKLTQTTMKTKSVSKNVPKLTDDEDDAGMHELDSNLSNTPPSAKKQKKSQPKKTAGAPLSELENDSVLVDDHEMTRAISNANTNKTATETYQKLTPIQHILKRPDTYIGSTEREEQTMWVFNSETSQMEWRKVTFVPGLYKIFDEVIVNAADNKQNDASMSYIKVTVDRETGTISVENNGRGIPVEIHEKEKIYVPELIFGHLLAGSNFDDAQAKTTGGRNGYGAKLCNIFSNEFILETQDSNTGKRYKQIWTDHMGKMGKAKISASKTTDFTRVTFTPDYKKFHMSGIDDDFEALIKRRVYDMAGTIKGVKVYLNGTWIKVNWKSYIEMYAKAINKERGTEVEMVKDTVIIEKPDSHERWDIGFAVSDGSFQQVSFVNSIATSTGGTHVNYIADQICERLADVVKKKNSKGATLKTNQIRNHIFLFVNCLITNPAFTSQTKEQLTTRPKQFGSTCILSDDFLKKISKTEAVENILNFAARKADQELAKSDGNKRTRMSNHKLVDANLAGTKRGYQCTLILTEGDSAKGLAVAGRAVLDPDKIGVFPLRGKLLNVRDASIDQISKNTEIQNIKQILGLKHKQHYTNTHGLRYGQLVIMADQDYDGSHIKGLLINFLAVQFPSLLRLPNFLAEFITPIVRVWKGPDKKPKIEKSFFTMPQYEMWRERHANEKTWKMKYYKGLGTSKPEDAQKYFGKMDDHLINFATMTPPEEDLLELAFAKKRIESRKQWLGTFTPGTYIDHSTQVVSIDDFINKELILFSMADNIRSIPSVIDGLKPGQRKVMYACFKKNLTSDMKVAELSGYVSNTTAYHHGEASMHATIVNLAQDFVGSNNVNCLEPSGNFGTRLAGGGDAASARYIFTRLSRFARRVFSVLDDPLYEHNVDDGQTIEPVVYCPVVPMVLLNGADGIGTGYSTSIPNYHPVDVVNNLKRRMGRLEGQNEPEAFKTMAPWFRGWKGTVEEAGPNRYNMNGLIREAGDNEVEITELPIRMWTDDFKARLEEIIKAEKVPSFIKDYREFNDHKTVHFIIQLDDKHMKAALEEGLAERFKLNKTIATSNLVAFDQSGRLQKYENVESILEEFYHYRFALYTKRKAYWLGKMEAEYRKLQNQARFVLEIIDNKLVVSKKKKAEIVAELRKRDYEPFPKVQDAKKAGESEEVVEGADEAADDDENSGARDYDYLLGMPIWSLTKERVDKLREQMHNKHGEIDSLKDRSEADLWCEDLDAFVAEWEAELRDDAEIDKAIRQRGRRHSQKLGAGKTAKGKAKDDEEFNPKAAKASKASVAKGVVKVDPKPHKRFLEMFGSKPQAKPAGESRVGADGAEDLSDDDFAVLAPSKETLRAPSVQPAGGRTKRAAAAVPKNWVVDGDEDSESDDGQYLGDVGAMVKGIGDDEAPASQGQGRLSLFAMSRPSTNGSEKASGRAGLSKAKAKPAKVIDLSDDDDTNYAMLAKPSPQKVRSTRDELNSFLSSEDDLPAVVAPLSRPGAKAAPKPVVGKSVVSKPTSKPAVLKKAAAGERAAKPTTMSPAAKAYAAKQTKLQFAALSSDDDDDDDDVVATKKPAARRPAKITDDLDDDDDDEDEMPVKTKSTSRKTVKPASQGKDTISSQAKPVRRTVPTAALDDDEDDDEDETMPPLAVTSRRPARTATKAKPLYVDSDEEGDTAMTDFDASAVMEEEEEEEDDFDDDDE